MQVLGLILDHDKDTLLLSKDTKSAITKTLAQRLVLSPVSNVYDRIGFFLPFTIGARLIWKNNWRVNRLIELMWFRTFLWRFHENGGRERLSSLQ